MPISSALSYTTQQWIVCFLCSLALALISVKNISFYSITEIVEKSSENNRLPDGGCHFLYNDSYYHIQKVPFVLPYFFWQNAVMTTALSALYVGKIVTFVPAGMLADLGFSRYVLCGGVSLMTVAYLSFSFFTSYSVALMLESLVEGISEALIYPSIFTLIVRWAPASKRNLFTAIVISGVSYGQVLGQIFFRLTYLKFKSLNVGLFATGVIWLVWLILGYFFIHHSPFVASRNPSSIDSPSAGFAASIRRRRTAIRVARLRGIPWRNIFCSRPFLSLVLVFCSVNVFVSYNFTSLFQQYQAYILRLPTPFLKVASSIVVVEVPSLLITGFTADYIIERNLISKIFLNKSFTFASMFIATVAQIAAVFSGCDVILFWVLSFVAVYVLGHAKPLICTNVIDLAPLYAGVMTGIICCADTIFDVLEGRLTVLMSYGYWAFQIWRVEMIIYFVEGLVMIVPYLIFGSVRLQPWTSTSSSPSVSPLAPSTVGQDSTEEAGAHANGDDEKQPSTKPSMKRLLPTGSSFTGTNKLSQPSTS